MSHRPGYFTDPAWDGQRGGLPERGWTSTTAGTITPPAPASVCWPDPSDLPPVDLSITVLGPGGGCRIMEWDGLGFIEAEPKGTALFNPDSARATARIYLDPPADP